MEAILYKGNDKPCTLSVTHLKDCVIVNMCLDVKTTEVPVSDEYPDGKCYEYVNISGVTPGLTVRGILKEIALLGYFDRLNADFVQSLADACPEVDMLTALKDVKCWTIDMYDTSENVNSFSLGGMPMWLSLEERKSMRQSLIALKAEGIDTFTYWSGLIPFSMPVAQFEAILNAVEVYALTCFNTTAQHKADVYKLTSLEEIMSYDVTAGYPQKLQF